METAIDHKQNANSYMPRVPHSENQKEHVK